MGGSTLNKKTIQDIPLEGKTVLLRSCLNVPVGGADDDRHIASDFRLVKSLPTIKYLLDKNCKVVIVSHLGRPKGYDKELSFDIVAKRLEELLKQEVKFCPEVIGPVAEQQKKQLKNGQVLVLENLRFNGGERANDSQFAKQLAKQCDYFVQDDFSDVHRQHASTVAICQQLPAVAGLLVVSEVKAINHSINDSKKPKCAIIGGLKIATKIDLIDEMFIKMDKIVLAGAMANTFYAAMGKQIGVSIYDKTEVGVAKELLDKFDQPNSPELFIGLDDVAVANSIEQPQPRKEVNLESVSYDELILDLGSDSTKKLIEFLSGVKTVVWNGPLGFVEQSNFSYGSAAIAKWLASNRGVYKLVGGGDTAEFIESLKLMSKMDFVSSGGGASLELISGLPLPGVEALMDR